MEEMHKYRFIRKAEIFWSGKKKTEGGLDKGLKYLECAYKEDGNPPACGPTSLLEGIACKLPSFMP